MKQFEDQRLRGINGFGLYERVTNHLIRTPKERKILSYLRNHKRTSVMFHHRFPTSTVNVKNACHPFSTRDYFKDMNYVLVHNGVIINDDELKKDHDKLGITYHSLQEDGTYNDSEALLWDVALYLEGKQTELKAKGSIAFVVMDMPKDKRKTTKMYFARNYGSPLNLDVTDSAIYLSSEGRGKPIQCHSLYEFNLKSHDLSEKSLVIPSYYYDNSRQSTTPYQPPYWYDRDDNEGYTPSPSLDIDKDGHLITAKSDKFIDPNYKVIPAKVLYTWDKVMTDSPPDEMYVMVKGRQVPVRRSIKTRVEEYLDDVDGVYEQAADDIEGDLAAYKASILHDEINDLEVERDELLEVDLLNAALEVLYTCPYWNKDNGTDPGYIQSEKEAQKLIADSIRKQIEQTELKNKAEQGLLA